MATPPSLQLRALRVKKKRTLPSKGKASEEQLSEILLVAAPTTGECIRKKEAPQLPPRNEMVPSDSNASWLQNPIDPAEICLLRVLLLRLVKDLEGNDCFKDMGAYVCKVLGNSESNQSAESEDKEAEVMWKLRCTVTRIAKTPLEGKSTNVYCVAGLLPDKHRENGSVLSGDLKDWFQHKLLREMSTTATCTIAEDTPLTETIDLSVSDLPYKVLVVEVWQPKKKDGTKRRSLLALLKTSDKFVGRILHPFEKIPLEQEAVTATLHSHSLKSERGDLSLQMRLVRNKTEDKAPGHTAALNGYRTLFRAIVKYESHKTDGKSPGPARKWSAEVSPQAKQLLLTYATWNSLSVLQRAAIQLSVLLQYHKYHGVEIDACTGLMGMMQEQNRLRERVTEVEVTASSPKSTTSPQDSPTRDTSPRDPSPSPGEWPNELRTQLAELGDDLQDTLGRHLVLLEDNLTSVEQLRRCVVALQKLYELRPPVDKLHEDGRTFQKTLECCIKRAVKNWFENCSTQLTSQRAVPTLGSLQGRQGKAQVFYALCDACNEMCTAIQKDLVAIFNLNNFNYLLVFLEFVDKELKDLCKDFLSSSYAPGDDPTRTSIASYRAYITCRKIGACGSTHGFKNKLELPLHCHQWFEPEISNWFAAANMLCKERINKAIETDEIIQDVNEAKHSSSAGKVTVCLMQMVSFWKNLDWPDCEMAFGFMLQMFEKVCGCVQYYVNKVYNRLTDKDLHDSAGNFHASEQLCVVFNNISHMKKQLDVVCQRLDVRNLCDKMEVARRKESEEAFNQRKQSTRGDIEMILLNMARHISENLKPKIRRLISAWMKVPGETSACSIQVFAPLQNYIIENLQILGDYLLDDVFQLVLATVWTTTVDCSLSVLHKSPSIHHHLRYTLSYLKQLFSAEGSGLNEESLNATLQYKVLVTELELRQLSTRDLVLRCCADLAEQQAKAVGSPEHKLGELTLSVGYCKEKAVVEVTVVCAKNLSTDERLGTLVEVWLLPQLLFQVCTNKQYKSEVVKSPDPLYNKQFMLPATEENMRTEGSVLVFGVSDSGDTTTTTIRVCAISCKDISMLEEQPAHCNAEQPAHCNAEQPAHCNAEQPAHCNAEQPAHCNAEQPAQCNAEQPAHCNAEQPANCNAEQPVNYNAEQPANCNVSSLPLFVIQYADVGLLRELAYRHSIHDAEASYFYQYLTKTLQVSVSMPQ